MFVNCLIRFKTIGKAKKREYYIIIMLNGKKIRVRLGQNIRGLRLQRNLTQEQLADAINIQPQSIGQIEIGRTFISSEKLADLCNFFQLDPVAFFNNHINSLSEQDINYIQEIKRLLPLLSTHKLKEIYEILLVVKNNN